MKNEATGLRRSRLRDSIIEKLKEHEFMRLLDFRRALFASLTVISAHFPTAVWQVPRCSRHAET
jgi:hypothetical protein